MRTKPHTTAAADRSVTFRGQIETTFTGGGTAPRMEIVSNEEGLQEEELPPVTGNRSRWLSRVLTGRQVGGDTRI